MDFTKNDRVFTKARLFHTTGMNRQEEPMGHQKYYLKLTKRYYDPFLTLQRINVTSYRVKISANWNVKTIFHVSLLKPYNGQLPKAPIQEEPHKSEEHEETLWPDTILRHEDNMLRNNKTIHKSS